MRESTRYTFEVMDFGTKGKSKTLPLKHIHVTGHGKTRAQRRAHALEMAKEKCRLEGMTFQPVIAYKTPKTEFTGHVVSPAGEVVLRGRPKPLPFRGAERVA